MSESNVARRHAEIMGHEQVAITDAILAAQEAKLSPLTEAVDALTAVVTMLIARIDALEAR